MFELGIQVYVSQIILSQQAHSPTLSNTVKPYKHTLWLWDGQPGGGGLNYKLAYRKPFAAQLKTPVSSSKRNKSKSNDTKTRGMRCFAPHTTTCSYITPRRLERNRSAPHNPQPHVASPHLALR